MCEIIYACISLCRTPYSTPYNQHYDAQTILDAIQYFCNVANLDMLCTCLKCFTWDSYVNNDNTYNSISISPYRLRHNSVLNSCIRIMLPKNNSTRNTYTKPLKIFIVRS